MACKMLVVAVAALVYASQSTVAQELAPGPSLPGLPQLPVSELPPLPSADDLPPLPENPSDSFGALKLGVQPPSVQGGALPPLPSAEDLPPLPSLPEKLDSLKLGVQPPSVPGIQWVAVPIPSPLSTLESALGPAFSPALSSATSLPSSITSLATPALQGLTDTFTTVPLTSSSVPSIITGLFGRKLKQTNPAGLTIFNSQVMPASSGGAFPTPNYFSNNLAIPYPGTAPTGAMSLSDAEGNVLGTSPVQNGRSVIQAIVPPGLQTLTSSYSGDSFYAPSTSTALYTISNPAAALAPGVLALGK